MDFQPIRGPVNPTDALGLPEAMIVRRRNLQIAQNHAEYGLDAERLRWLTPEAAAAAETERARWLSALPAEVAFCCQKAKLDCRRMSPGCRICGEGLWSCLFINGVCNCRCFYCPTSQDDSDVPVTNGLPFPDPADYVEYVERFGFKGVSISGGEPLMTVDRSLDVIAAIKRRFGDRIHVWLYTNGTLVTPDVLRRLADAGLDEIRFDIGATGYQTDRAASAVGVIDTVTVEIPAIPEERERLKEAIFRLADAGIDYLNLHQLRLTPHNFRHLVDRPYTFLHGDKVTVLESEWAALELIGAVEDARIGLPINYCGFAYKYRFQRAAVRRRMAPFMQGPQEEVTPAGYLRHLCLHGDPADIAVQAQRLTETGFPAEGFRVEPAAGRLHFLPNARHLIDFTKLRLAVGYFLVSLRPALSYTHPFKEVRLSSGKRFYLEKCRAARDVWFEGPEIDRFFQLAIAGTPAPYPLPDADGWDSVFAFEFIPSGLQDYF